MRLGSHNTMTYLRPSQWWLRPFAWVGRCQYQTIGEQFIVWGVRWFDIRLAFDKKGKPYFAHGIFSYKDKDPFAILDYLNTLASPDDKAYVRLLNERDSEFNKKCFKHFCDSVDVGLNRIIIDNEDWYIDLDIVVDGYVEEDSGDYYTPPEAWLKSVESRSEASIYLKDGEEEYEIEESLVSNLLYQVDRYIEDRYA